jgi:hypothetical protein
MMNLLKKMIEIARREIKERFENMDSRISLALDCWTSSNRWEFMDTSPSVIAGEHGLRLGLKYIFMLYHLI